MPWLAALWAKLAANGWRVLWRVIVTVALCILFYAVVLKPFLKPNPTTVQNGGYSFTLQPKSYFGCSNWQIKPVDPLKE
jgi:peptidoglycan/LPS O-acetylase OafA/YrhL